MWWWSRLVMVVVPWGDAGKLAALRYALHAPHLRAGAAAARHGVDTCGKSTPDRLSARAEATFVHTGPSMDAVTHILTI